MSAAIAFERVSKHFRGPRSYRSLRDDVARALGRGRREGAGEEVVAALDDVSFTIQDGESFALIGANGAGKTTALKLASRIMYPTAGTLRVRGRVGALIEVGTGMHPELTGRENVNLYGRILGFSRREIERRFDEIVSFADIGPALEQPVKQFSSGMQLRLGFALASHLEPDVLLVDEAIAVGDAGFQYRCVERMTELVREGRTLVFVSHQMSAIETLCERAVVLDHGHIADDGPARDVIRGYLSRLEDELLSADVREPGARGRDLEIVKVSIHDASGHETDHVTAGSPMAVRLHYRAHRAIANPNFEVGLSDGPKRPFALASMLIDGDVPDVVFGDGVVECVFEDLPLFPRMYEVWAGVRGGAGFGDLVKWQRMRLFRVRGEIGKGLSAVTHSLSNAPVRLPYRWNIANGTDERSG
ncbi:MAG: ABC transporter ATP-binding protein [Thermoleophilia bacterium]|nr:ABC transporter ATP-binding protein [Thermoleophilia bacterium]